MRQYTIHVYNTCSSNICSKLDNHLTVAVLQYATVLQDVQGKVLPSNLQRVNVVPGLPWLGALTHNVNSTFTPGMKDPVVL